MKTKTEQFQEAYGELVKKYNCDFASFPIFVPDQQGKFVVVIQTMPIDLEEQRKQQVNQAFISK